MKFITLRDSQLSFLHPTSRGIGLNSVFLKKLQIAIILIFCILSQGMSFATTTLKIAPTKIQLNDTFNLILSTDAGQSAGLPNLTPLQHDFTVLGTQRSVSYSIINGQTSSNSQWIILLRPRRAGNLTIPAIKIGQEQTAPRSIEVSASNLPETTTTITEDGHDSVMLRTEVDDKAPYVNQQVLYTVKLMSNKQLINAQYQPPRVENALLIPLGDGRHYETQIHGEYYAVEEQQYVIYPQKSGALVLYPPTFQATIYDDFPKEVTAADAKTVPISVRPAPKDYQGKYWLPAKKIELTEAYDPPGESLKKGDAITRTVTLQAVAMPSQLLPTLSFDVSGGFNVYPDTPEVKNTFKQNQLVGTSTIKVTYLVNQEGRITIPSLELPWFNTTTGRTEIAVLPARTLMVAASGNATTDTLSHTAEIKQTKLTGKVPKRISKNSLDTGRWQTIQSFIAGFGVALVTVALLWWFRRASKFSNARHHHAAVKRLQLACLKNRPNDAREALMDWARIEWPQAAILNLQDIGKMTRDPALKKQLLQLNQVLYHNDQSHHWQGESLWQSFKSFRPSKPTKGSRRRDLPPINPTS